MTRSHILFIILAISSGIVIADYSDDIHGLNPNGMIIQGMELAILDVLLP